MEFLQEYSLPVIVGICLCIGYIIKHSLDFVPGKYIPLIMGVLGLGINIALHWGGITAEVVLGGLFSGLASTGLHQAFTKIIEKM